MFRKLTAAWTRRRPGRLIKIKSRIFRRLVLAGLLFFASAAQAEHYTVPLLVPAGTSSEPQRVVRILNGTDVGDARLQIETDLSIVPLAFVRAADGTLSAMHDTVRGASVGESDGYTYEVPIFNPASDATQVSRLAELTRGGSLALGN